MTKHMRINLTAILALAVIIQAGVVTGASSFNGGAKILRAEYQGMELSRDRRNPTVLPMTDSDISIDIIGNYACASLGNASINAFSQAGAAGGGNTYFDASGKCVYFLNDHKAMYVGNDVIDYYWRVNAAANMGGNEIMFTSIPDSESPVYYITFNAGQSGYIPPAGDEPAVLRAELKGVELSRDRNNPTPIPYANRITLYGNSACVSLTAGIYAKYNGEQSYSGPVVYFNSSAIAACDNLSAPFDIVRSNSGSQKFNEAVAIELIIHTQANDENNNTQSPIYYVSFLEPIIEGALLFSDIEDGYWAQPYIQE